MNKKGYGEQCNNVPSNGIYATLQEQTSSRGQKKFLYEVHNKSDKSVTMIFPTSQKFDFKIINDQGIELETYSKEKMYMQVQSEVSVQPGETFLQTISLNYALRAGNYSLEVWLTSHYPEAFKQKIKFEINNNKSINLEKLQ